MMNELGVIPWFVKEDLDYIKALLDVEFGFDIFNKSHKREIVDARRLFVALICSKYSLFPQKRRKKKSNSTVLRRKGLLTQGQLGEYMGYTTKSAHSTIWYHRSTFMSLCVWNSFYSVLFDRYLKLITSNDDTEKEMLQRAAESLAQQLSLINNRIKELQGYEKNK